jgi:membrane protein
MLLIKKVLGVFVTAFRRLSEERVPEAGATIAFFAVFSLFPLLLLVVAAGSFFLDSPEELEKLLNLVLRFLPVSRDLVRENVLAVVRTRGAFSWIGFVGLIWSATGAFSALVRNLSRAWAGGRPPGVLIERLQALALVGTLVALVLVYLLALTALNLPEEWLAAQNVLSTVIRHLSAPSRPLLFLFIFGLMTLLYRWLPRAGVLWREAAVGGLAAAVGLTLATAAFTWFVRGGLLRYNVVYGSLGTLLALLSWVYVASVVTLSGEHLAAALAWHTRGEGARPETPEEAAVREESEIPGYAKVLRRADAQDCDERSPST